MWHQTTVVNIARNTLLVAVASFGLRSKGDKLRFAPEGPRELDDGDFREDEKPKVVRNPESRRITAPTLFDPLVDVERQRRLLAKLDARGGTQRGKARSHDPTKNPLGGRIFDMNCNWLMYRTPYGKTFRYGCGSYLQFSWCNPFAPKRWSLFLAARIAIHPGRTPTAVSRDGPPRSVATPRAVDLGTPPGPEHRTCDDAAVV